MTPTISKQTIVDHLATLPEKVAVEQFINAILILYRADLARKQFHAGQYITHEELKRQIANGTF